MDRIVWQQLYAISITIVHLEYKKGNININFRVPASLPD